MKLLQASLGLLLTVVPAAFAHHSPTAEFDMSKAVDVTGTITKVEWTNPHIWWYVDVKDADGKVTNWGFTGGPPAFLIRVGVTKNSLKVGDVVTVHGFRAKDGSNNANGVSVRFADGRQAFVTGFESGVDHRSLSPQDAAAAAAANGNKKY